MFFYAITLQTFDCLVKIYWYFGQKTLKDVFMHLNSSTGYFHTLPTSLCQNVFSCLEIDVLKGELVWMVRYKPNTTKTQACHKLVAATVYIQSAEFYFAMVRERSACFEDKEKNHLEESQLICTVVIIYSKAILLQVGPV